MITNFLFEKMTINYNYRIEDLQQKVVIECESESMPGFGRILATILNLMENRRLTKAVNRIYKSPDLIIKVIVVISLFIIIARVD